MKDPYIYRLYHILIKYRKKSNWGILSERKSKCTTVYILYNQLNKEGKGEEYIVVFYSVFIKKKIFGRNQKKLSTVISSCEGQAALLGSWRTKDGEGFSMCSLFSFKYICWSCNIIAIFNSFIKV